MLLIIIKQKLHLQNRIGNHTVSRIRVDFEYVDETIIVLFLQQVIIIIFIDFRFGNIYSQRDMPSSPLGIT